MVIGMLYKDSKIVDVTKQNCIGFTQDLQGVWSVLELDVILDKPIKILEGMTHKIKLYEISGCPSLGIKSVLTDVKPHIHHI